MTKSLVNQGNKTREHSQEITREKIQNWMFDYLAELLEIEPEEVDVETNFARYGLDSSAATVLTGDLAIWLEKELEPTLLYDYPTIAKLIDHLVQ